MSRPLRLELAGGIYHVTSRGDRREEIYVDDSDHDQWLALFGQVCKRFNGRCHAYCLMSNQVYLLLTPHTEGGIGKVMQSLGRYYVQYFNYRYQRTGTLWEGRVLHEALN